MITILKKFFSRVFSFPKNALPDNGEPKLSDIPTDGARDYFSNEPHIEYSLFLSYADDPTFSWEAGNWEGNVPKRVVVFDDLLGLQGCGQAHCLLRSPKYGGRQLDWGASGARLNKAQIIEFLTDFYSGDDKPPGVRLIGDLPAKRHLPEILSKLDDLPDDRLYVLVSCES